MSAAPGAGEEADQVLAWDLLRTTDVLAFVVDESGGVLLFNPACERLTGLRRTDLAGQVLWDVVCDPESRDDMLAVVQALMQGAPAMTRDHAWMGASGSSAVVQWTYCTIRCRGGTAVAALGYDVTRERREVREVKQRYRVLYDQNPAPCVVLGLDLKVHDINRAVTEHLGWTRDEVVGRDPAEFVVPQQRERMREVMSRAVSGALPGPAELAVMARDGTVHTILFTPSRALIYEGPRATGLLLVGIDIQDRKKAEDALRRSEGRSRAILKVLPDLMFRLRVDGTVLEFYAPDDTLLYVPPSEIVGGRLQDALPPEVAEASLRCARQALATGGIATHEYRLDVPAGTLCFEARHIVTGEPDEVLAIVRDVTDRRRAEQALRDSERNYRMLMERASDGILIMDEAGRILSVNPRACEMLGRDQGDLLGMSLEELVDDPQRHRLPERFRELCEGATLLLDLPLLRDDRSRLDVEVSAKSLPTGPIQGIVRDVTERKRAGEALRRSEESFRMLIERSPSMILVHRQDRVVYCNQAAAAALGYDEPQQLVGKAALELLHPDDRPAAVARIEHHARTGEAMPAREERLLCRDGTVRWVEIAGIPLQFQGADSTIAVAHDITARKLADAERRRLEEHIQQSQKLESLGVLAGGIAHDFNNLLMGVLGNAGLAMMELGADSRARESIQRVEVAALRAADLTKQLLAYSGRGRFVVQPLDLKRVVEEMIDLLDTAISKKATLRLSFAPDLPRIEADSNQICQVIMNLITNASDALGEGEGLITLRIGTMHADLAYLTQCYLHDELPEGQYVTIEVSDTGCGIPPEAVSRIFDPFFTTKFTGRGLGLAAVLGIVRGHHGAIKLHSQPGRGTCVTVLLPPTTLRLATKPAVQTEGAAPSSGIVLVVDDEEAVRAVAKAALVRCGFRVMTAPDGYEALQTLAACVDDVALVLLDMTMPRMRGEEALREIRRLRPSLPVLLSSGYSEQEALGRLDSDPAVSFIQKPYTPSVLIDKIRKAISR